MATSAKYPPIRPGKFSFWGGVAAHMSRPLGNWQSDFAVDLRAPAGTPVFATESGVIDNLGFIDNGRTVWGWKFTLVADSGERYYYAHLNKPRVVENQRVKAGEFLATVGSPPYFGSHLHMGQMNGNPEDTYKLPWPEKKPVVPYRERKVVWKVKDARWVVRRLKRLRKKLHKQAHKD